MADARFEDGAEQPLRLKAESAEDLAVLSAMVQDAVAQTAEMSWLPRHRRFALLINRFRWEDRDQAAQQKRAYERVQATLVIDGALKVRSNGIDPADKDLVLDLLALRFVEGDAPAGRLTLIFAGDGEIAIDVECLDVTLTDQSRPYVARAKEAPRHPLD
ncbi:DUF2948 family protein [Oceanomicrobium pacificus]|uniref:DUF2948 family protein n=1 Tax=Oceanomicrobium pacificus TaxID=2692916 RepID=A0A6B0TPL2_9RHOB|nr:DUF2948 family protein [Oceanomicrobium pacificus]MXU66537.1 DUF2948 family protein [Oceanomicrobium pacificus]